MLPREYRLKKRVAFQATYRTGKSFHKDGVTMFCGRDKKVEMTTKVGFVVSKKIHKRAVKRNRIKRLMRESYRLILKNQGVETNCMSLIFVASTRLIGKDFNHIDVAMKKLVNCL